MPKSLAFDDLHTIAETLAAGFQTLLTQVEEQKKIEEQLRRRLDQASHKGETTDKSCDSSSVAIRDWRNEIVRPLESSVSNDYSPFSTPDAQLVKARAAVRRLSEQKMPSLVQSRRCPVTNKTTDQEDFEHDFTTLGRIGDLGCPFAKMPGDGNPQCGPDPIAEEFHGEMASGRSRSSGAAGSRCPIRFLDKHSPEEIAQYFENHKHEIPRSHQICVKRYQQNDESIRQLDAKYGSLVSMIQGLGNKHKQYLPQNEKVADEPERDSTKAVEQWAENISHHPVQDEETDRVPHFERPLRDVRVGESPSRPWGISVPVDQPLAPSALPSETGVQPPAKPSPAAADHVENVAAGHRSDHHSELAKQRQPSTHTHPQIAFNGPVFFGYSAEQAALFLKNLNINGCQA